jgi:hypothetical protein
MTPTPVIQPGLSTFIPTTSGVPHGGGIDDWYAMSGNGRHLQAGSVLQYPLMVQPGIANYRSVHFQNGVNCRFDRTGAETLAAPTTQYLVVQQVASLGYGGVMIASQGLGGGERNFEMLGGASADGDYCGVINNPRHGGVNTHGTERNDPHVCVIGWDGSSEEVALLVDDGAYVTLDNTAIDETRQGIVVGSSAAKNNPFHGWMAEVVIYDAYHSEAQMRDVVDNYLRLKYKIGDTSNQTSLGYTTGLLAHYAPETLPSGSDGDPMTRWYDADGLGRTLECGGSTALRTNVQNSLNAMSLRESGNNGGGAFPDKAITYPRTYIFAYTLDAHNNLAKLAWNVGGDGDPRVRLGTSNNWELQGETASCTLAHGGTANFEVMSVKIATDGTGEIYIDDGGGVTSTACSSLGTPAAADIGLRIGDLWSGAFNSAVDARICEILVYDHELTGTNRNAVVAYLKTKYNI